MINRVNIVIIKPEHQRYRTVGDWQIDYSGTLTIYVSKSSDWRQDMLIAIHELTEAVLCTNNGITPQQVDKFDLDHQDCEEPGLLPEAPYYKEHMIATGHEMILAQNMNVDWNAYEEELGSLLDKAVILTQAETKK